MVARWWGKGELKEEERGNSPAVLLCGIYDRVQLEGAEEEEDKEGELGRSWEREEREEIECEE